MNKNLPDTTELDRMKTVELLNRTAEILNDKFGFNTYLADILKDRAVRIKKGLDFYDNNPGEEHKPFGLVLQTVNMSINEFKGELIKMEDELKGTPNV